MNSQYSKFNIQHSTYRGFTPTPVLASLRFSKTAPSSFWKFPQDLRQTMRSVGALKQWQNRCRGFTLVEMIVAIGLFTIVLFIASSAFLAVLNADRKSRATRIAMDNLNLSLEDMSRRIKTGTSYYCNGTVSSVGTNDCLFGGELIAFTEQDGTTRTAYRLDLVEGIIKRTRGSSGTELSVTAPEITISNLKFIVSGSTVWVPPSASADTVQPYVVILVEGTTNTGKITSGFKMQTTVVQRAYDI